MIKLATLIRNSRVIFLNSIICGVIGTTFGILNNHALPWISGGLLIGALLGLFLHQVMIWFKVRKERNLRGYLILLILEVLLVYYILIPTYGAYHTVHPVRLPIMATPQEMGIAYESISLMTEDHTQIEGWYVPSTNGAAIIGLHGLNGNRTHVMPYMQPLVEQGYGILLFDLRAHGQSGGEHFAAAWDSDQEVLVTLDFLKERPEIDPERIGAIGLSAGAHAVLYAAAKTEDLQAVFVDGTGIGQTVDVLSPLLPELHRLFFGIPMNFFHHVMIEFYSKSPPAPPLKETVTHLNPRPILFIAAGADAFESAIAARYVELAGENAELWIVPDIHHLGGIFTYPEEYKERMLNFFDDTLLKVNPATGS